MKRLLILLLIPYSVFCQTVHLKDGRIAYKGSEKINMLSLSQLKNGVEKAIEHTNSKIVLLNADSSANEITVHATMQLTSNQTFINSIQYHLMLTLKEDAYQYTIDSVIIFQNERGYNTTTWTSEEFVKRLENSGPVATAAEALLNEIDMRFQQLLDFIKNHLKK